MKLLHLVFLILTASCVISEAATLGVTVNTTNVLVAPFIPSATSGTQVINGPAWRQNATTLGTTTYSEGYEELTPGASVTLNWLLGRTKGIALDQNTTFSFSNTPTVTTNIQRMVVGIVGDGVSTVSFTGVDWQTTQVTTPTAGVITLYFLEAKNSSIKGYMGGGSGSGVVQVFSGFYGGGLPTDTPTTTAALAYDWDSPGTLYMWDTSGWY